MMDSLSFNPEKDGQLQQLLKQVEGAECLRNLLFQNQPDFVLRLTQTNELSDVYLRVMMPQKLRRLAIIKLYNRLVKWQDWSLFLQSQPFQDLTKLVFVLCSEDRQRFQILKLIIEKVNSPVLIVAFLEQLITVQRKSIISVQEDSLEAVKKFLIDTHVALNNPSTQGKLKQYIQSMSECERRQLKIKIIKIFSHAFYQEDLGQFQIDGLYENCEGINNYEQFVDLLSINCQKAATLIKDILLFKVEERGVGYEIINVSKVDKLILSDDLFKVIFEYSSEGYSCFQFQSQFPQKKEIIFKYNFVGFSEGALSNILPHRMITKEDDEASQKQAEFFLQRLKQLLSILGKISDGWKLLVYHLNSGQVQIEQCHKERLIEVCLEVWSNILKHMIIFDRQDLWYDQTNFKLFHKSEQCKPQSIINVMQGILSDWQMPSIKALIHICFIINSYRTNDFYPFGNFFKNKPFINLIIQKVNKVVSLTQQQPLPAELTRFFIDSLDKFQEQKYQISTLPINHGPTFQYVIKFAFFQSFYLRNANKGPYFFRHGLFDHNKPDTDAFEEMFKHYPAFKTMVSENCLSELIKITKNTGMISSDLEKQIIGHLFQISVDKDFDMSQEIAEAWTIIIKSKPGHLLDLSNPEKLMNKIKFKIDEEQRKVIDELLLMLGKKQLLAVEPKILIDSIWTDDSELLWLNSRLQLWYLLQPYRSRLLNRELYSQILQIFLLLKQVLGHYRVRIVEYLVGLKVDELQSLQKYYAKQKSLYTNWVANSCKNLFEKVISNLGYSDRQTIFHFLFKDNTLINAILNNLNNPPLTRSYLQLLSQSLQSFYQNGKQTFFGATFYFKNKEILEDLLVSLYLRYDIKNHRSSDRSDDSNYPQIESVGIQSVLKSNPSKKPSDIYNQQISTYMLYNVQLVAQQCLRLQTSARQVFINNKLYRGGKNLILVQKSIIVAFIDSIALNLKIENLKYYQKIITKMIQNIQDLVDCTDPDIPDQIQQCNIDQYPPNLNILNNKDCDQVYSQALITLLQQIIKLPYSTDNDQLVELILERTPDKQEVSKEKGLLLKTIFTQCQEMFQEESKNLRRVCQQLKWLSILSKKTSRQQFMESISGFKIERLLQALIEIFCQIKPQKKPNQQGKQEIAGTVSQNEEITENNNEYKKVSVEIGPQAQVENKLSQTIQQIQQNIGTGTPESSNNKQQQQYCKENSIQKLTPDHNNTNNSELNQQLKGQAQAKVEQIAEQNKPIEGSIEIESNLLNEKEPQENKQLDSLEYLNDMLPLLSRLVPELQTNEQPQNIVLFTKNVLSLILKIAIINDYNDKDYFAAIAKKINVTSNLQIMKLLNQFLQRSGPENTASVLCQIRTPTFEQVLMEADIKAFFLKKALEQAICEGPVQTELQDIAFAFKKRYRDRLNKFRDMLLSFGQKFTNSSGKICIRYLARQPFDFCRSIGCEFMSFKPPLVLRSQIQHITQLIAQDIEENQEWFQVLQNLIYHYPVLTPAILFHPVNTSKYQGSTFLDILIKAAIDKREKPKKLLEFICVDNSSLVRGREKVYFMSRFVLFRVLQLVAQSELTPQILIFVFSFLRFKAFSQLCNLNIFKEKQSFRSLIEQKYINRMEQEGNNGQIINVAALAILCLLYRSEYIEALRAFCEFECVSKVPDSYLTQDWFIELDVPLSKIQLDRSIGPQQLQRKNEGQLLLEMQALALKCENIKQYSKNGLYSAFQASKDLYINHCGFSIQIQERIGSLQEIKQLQEIPEGLKYTTKHNHKYVLKNLTKWYGDQDRSNACFKKNQLLRPQTDLTESRTKSEHNQPTVTLQPTRFAPEDYALQPSPSPISQSEDNQQDQQKKIQTMFLQAFRNIEPQQPLSSEQQNIKDMKLSEETLRIIHNINDVLRLQGKPDIDISQSRALTQESLLQWIRLKQIEIEFDFKEETCATAQFEEYCLSNALKLQRLPSSKRNKVKLIEEHMLQSYLQRSFSGDEIDYLIDTMDQNYQQLSKLQRRLTKVEDVYTVLKPHRQRHFLTAEQIPAQVFPKMSQELLWSVVLSFYQQTIIIEVQSLVSFLQNKHCRNKLINTLIFVLRNPFENGVFPNCIKHFNQKTKQQVQQQQKRFRLKVLKFILSLRSHGLYVDENYLLQQVDYSGLKDITLQPHKELKACFNPQTHVPLLELAIIGLQSNLKNPQKLRLLRGLQHFPDCIVQKIIELIKSMNVWFTKQRLSDKEKANRVSNYFSHRKTYDSKVNFATVLKNPQIIQKIREIYPISQQTSLDPFMLCLFMHSDVYSPQEYKAAHHDILKREPLKSTDIFFCGEVLRYYSDQQLKTVPWLRQDANVYIKVFEKFIGFSNNLQSIAKEQIFRLMKMSDTLHFKIKSQILNLQVEEQKNQNSYSRSEDVLAKRERGIFQSAFQQLRYQPDGFWLYNFDVKFVGLDGKKESGYGGGVAKEWYTYVTKGMVNLNYGLFCKTSKNYYYINRESWINPRHLQFFEFIGKIFALSIINPKFFLAPRFSIVIYKAIVGQEVTMKDIINEFDQGEVLTNIEKMREYIDDSFFCESFVYQDKGLIADSNLTGTTNAKSSKQYLLKETEYLSEEGMNEQETNLKMLKVLKVGKTIELVPGGRDISVTKDNLEDFIRLTKQKIYDIIVGQTHKQINAFIQGVRKVISIKYLKKFTAAQLRQLAEGIDNISVEQLKKHAKISVTKNLKCLELFWQIIQELPPEDKVHFIHHWTGIPKISAEGIQQMSLQIRERNDEVRIFAHTCFNRIYLPPLETKQAVREAVLLAVNSVKQGMSIIED